MPVRAPRLCQCGKAAPSGERCPCRAKADAERKARYDKTRPSASERGLGADWRKLAAMHLARHPDCALCGKPIDTDQDGRRSWAIDHIISRAIAPSRRLDPTNLQTLCIHCHNSTKQRAERRTAQGKRK